MIFQSLLPLGGLELMDKKLLGTLRLLNSEMKSSADPILFSSVTIKSWEHLEDFLARASQRSQSFMKHIRRVVLHPEVIPDDTKLLQKLVGTPAKTVSMTLPIMELVLDLSSPKAMPEHYDRQRCGILAAAWKCRTIRCVQSFVSAGTRTFARDDETVCINVTVQRLYTTLVLIYAFIFLTVLVHLDGFHVPSFQNSSDQREYGMYRA